jgi:hypothetical protein
MDALALDRADEVIAALARQGHGDYSAHREAIAELWDGDYGLWQGNDEAYTDLGDPVLRDLRVVQEDHYDQHMDEDEKPEWSKMICSAGDYIWLA